MPKEEQKIKVKILINTYDFNLLAENESHEQSLRKAAKLMENQILRFKDENLSKEELLLVSCLEALVPYVAAKIENEERVKSASDMILDMQNEIKKRI